MHTWVPELTTIITVTYESSGIDDVVGDSDGAVNSETETLLLLLGDALIGESLDSHYNRLLARDRSRRARRL